MKIIMHLRIVTFNMIFPRLLPSPLSSILANCLVLTVLVVCILDGTFLHTSHAFMPLTFLLPFFLPGLCSQLALQSLLHIPSSSYPSLYISSSLWNPSLGLIYPQYLCVSAIHKTSVYHRFTWPYPFSVSK